MGNKCFLSLRISKKIDSNRFLIEMLADSIFEKSSPAYFLMYSNDSYYKGSYYRTQKLSKPGRGCTAPPGFEVFKVNNKKIYLFCTKTIQFGNSVKQCDFAIRKDRVRQDDDIIQHKHKVVNIEAFLDNNNLNVNQEIELQRSIATFLSANNIAINIIKSNSFKDMLLKAMSINSTNKQKSETILSKVLNPKLIRRTIVTIAEDNIHNALDVYQAHNPNSLCIDAGSQNMVSYVCIYVCNALIKAPPLLWHLEQGFKGTTSDYKTLIIKVLKELREVGIRIQVICSDNLKAQVLALNPEMPQSFHRDIDAEFRGIRWLPCSCHTLSLALIDLTKNTMFNEDVQNCEMLVSFLRTKKVRTTLPFIVPSITKTRWNSLFNSAFFIAKNYYQIARCLDSLHNEINVNDAFASFRSCFKITLLLWPFALAINNMESDRLSCTEIYPIILNAICICKEKNQRFEEILNYANILENYIQTRFITSKTGAFLRFLFSLTKCGRSYFRNTNEVDVPNTVSDPFTIIKRDILTKSRFKNDIESIYSYYPGIVRNYNEWKNLNPHSEEHGIKEQYSPLYGMNSLDVYQRIRSNRNIEAEFGRISYVENSDDAEEEDVQEIVNEEIHQELSENDFTLGEGTLDNYESLISTGTKILKDIAKGEGFTSIEANRWVINYYKWLIKNDDEIKGYQEVDDDILLYKIMASHKSFKQKSTAYYHMVPGLLSCPASEASCERGFWYLKRIIQNERGRTKLDLLKSRIINQSLTS